ncbi:hypothetical protein [Sphaerochaeta sp.]|uniref:hypothetical protein n=1 Tax=Sphaerochaeta sp. TaxID=1972642 RepID=UPI003D126B93
MFFTFGDPDRLSSIGQEATDLTDAKSKIEIAVIDDNPFAPREALLIHKFRIVELGPDIRSVDQVSTYSIIICDVSGVGKAFGSQLEGAHLVTEIRKAFPDKYLMAYTGMTYSLAITNALTTADKRMEKDASIEAWVQTLEVGISEVVNPRNRWIRFRRALLERGVELFDVLKLEQAFIKSVQNRNQSYLENKARSLGISEDFKDLIIKFSANAVAALVGKSLGI